MALDRALGKYRLLAALGHGGMADVYLAALDGPGGFNKLVVLKELRPGLATDADFVQMFLAEARLAARLAHPNIVQTYEVVSSDGRYFIVMEHLDGQSLNRVFSRSLQHEALPRGATLRILSEALAGLHYAHELWDYRQNPLEIVHRDVSPHNLFVTYDGQVKVVDFGIAKVADSVLETRVGLLKGKIGYMSPEQARAEPLDRRADVFGAGVILWELLAGRRLWQGVPEMTVLKRLEAGEIPSLAAAGAGVPEGLVAICSRALAPDRDDRFPTAAGLRAALEAALAEMPDAPTLRKVGELVAQSFSAEREQAAELLRRVLGDPSALAELGDGPLTSRQPGSLPSFSLSGESARSVVSSPTLDETAIITPKPPDVATSSLDDPGSRDARAKRAEEQRLSRALGAVLLLAGVGVVGWVAREPARFGADRPDPSAISGARQADTPRRSPEKPLVEVSGDLEANAVLHAHKNYLLKFTTFVLPGVTLTIEKGTTIYGDTATKGTLVVQPGGRILAEGTPEDPIVLTSENTPLGTARPGDWGGLIVLGNAPTNLKDGAGRPARGRIEGITSRGEYGGAVPDDDSGVLAYLRIEYSGTAIAPNNEINGLTLGAVGSRTSIHHVAVQSTADDCFEFFGGTVTASYLVCSSPGDDGFDWDYGYRGKLQFLVSTSGSTAEGESSGLEGDNDPNGSGNEPVSEPSIANVTLVGPGHPGHKPNFGMLFRRGTRANVMNALVTGFDGGLDVRDRTLVEVRSSAFFANGGANLAFLETPGGTGPLSDDDFGFDEVSFLESPARRILAVDPGLGPRGDGVPKPAHALSTNAVSPPNDGFFDASARYLGAFRDTKDDWDRGRWLGR